MLSIFVCPACRLPVRQWMEVWTEEGCILVYSPKASGRYFARRYLPESSDAEKQRNLQGTRPTGALRARQAGRDWCAGLRHQAGVGAAGFPNDVVERWFPSLYPVST